MTSRRSERYSPCTELVGQALTLQRSPPTCMVSVANQATSVWGVSVR